MVTVAWSQLDGERDLADPVDERVVTDRGAGRNWTAPVAGSSDDARFGGDCSVSVTC